MRATEPPMQLLRADRVQSPTTGRAAQAHRLHHRCNMRRRVVGLAVVAACALAPRLVAADPDHRPQDRFFFGVSAGATVVGERAAAVAYETSYWPTDWVGMGTYVSLSSDIYDLGAELMLAVPLRYVQPYAGVAGGARSSPSEWSMRLHGLAGMNGYVGRNLRVFVELRDVPRLDLIGGTHEALVLGGLRWSPDWFHRARGITKLDTIWWSMLLGAAGWTAATLAR